MIDVIGIPIQNLEQNFALDLNSPQELKAIIGDGKGIQGHACSSYLDVILFALFTFSQCFDSLLYRSAEPKVKLEFGSSYLSGHARHFHNISRT